MKMGPQDNNIYIDTHTHTPFVQWNWELIKGDKLTVTDFDFSKDFKIKIVCLDLDIGGIILDKPSLLGSCLDVDF